jgi:hypothetical protein
MYFFHVIPFEVTCGTARFEVLTAVLLKTEGKSKGKGKVCPITYHEGTQGE